MTWEQILPPPKGAGKAHFVTAITHYNKEIVEIIDVERVLADIKPYNTDIKDKGLVQEVKTHAEGMEVLLVDDSPVALAQARSTLEGSALKW